MYELTRYVSYIEKNNIYAVYCNFNLYFFKGDTYKWFKDFLEFKNIENINKEFIKYLLDKEIIKKSGELDA